MVQRQSIHVTPAKAGVQAAAEPGCASDWIPAFAGMAARGVGLASLLLLAACNRGEGPANNQAEPANAAAAQPEGDVAAAERLVRERLRNPPGLAFANPIRTASEGIALVCGEYRQAGATHRYVVVAGEDVFLEPEMEPGEMERAYSEFCREGSGNRPAPVAPQGNSQ